MISRRTVLRGIGAMLALPKLEIMAQTVGSSSPEDSPLRYVSVFQPNGVYPKAWDVEAEGANYAMSPILKPLESLRDDFMVLSGLNNSGGSGHVRMTSSFLTGTNLGNKGMGGSSIDQKIAQHIGADTAFKSLVFGTEPPRQGNVGKNPISIASTVSWNSPTTRISPEINPRIAFDRLFRGKTGKEAITEARMRQSVVDLVLDEAKSLRKKGSMADRQKIDEYLESVRSVEIQLERTLNPQKPQWVPPTKPSEADLIRPAAGIPRERDVHLRLMMDLMVLSLWTDSTRVCTLMTAHGFSRQNFSFIDGVTGDHHGISHHKEQKSAVDQYTLVSQWYTEQFAYFLNRLKAIDEGGSSLLDNSIVFYGSGMKDGNGHKKDNLPILVAGKGKGTLNQGRHIKLKSQALSNLHFTIGQKFGIEDSDFNNTGSQVIPELG